MRFSNGLLGGVVALAFGVAASASGYAQTFSWRLQTNLNPGEPGYVATEQKFAKLAESMSGGRLKLQVFPVGALFPIQEGLEAVGGGVAEIAMLTGGYYAGKIGPIANLENGVPGSLRTPIERYNFFYKGGFIELLRDVFAKRGIYYLGPQLSPPWDIMSKRPITSAKDFQGLKIRAFGVEAKWYEKLGATPVFLGGGDIYTGLATGVIDAMRWGPPSANMKNGYHEVAKFYVQPSPMPVPNNFYAVNLAAWNKLPNDLKAILEECAIASSLEYLALGGMSDAKAMRDMEAAGVKVTRIPDEEWARMEKEARAIWEAYSKEDAAAAKGVELLTKFLADLGR